MSYKSTFFAPFPCLLPFPPPTPSVFSLTPSLFIVLFFNYCCSPCALLCPLSLTLCLFTIDCCGFDALLESTLVSSVNGREAEATESQQHCHLNEIHTMTRPVHRPVQMGEVSQGPTLDKERKENQSSPETSPQVDFPISNDQL